MVRLPQDAGIVPENSLLYKSLMLKVRKKGYITRERIREGKGRKANRNLSEVIWPIESGSVPTNSCEMISLPNESNEI